MQNAEHHREQFELAYATVWAKDRNGDETPEQLAAEIKSWRIGDTYGEDLPRLRFGWEGYQWARASQCLAQIEEPADPAAVTCPAEALAKLRHLYLNMSSGSVRDKSSAKRIAEGLLAPAIAALEAAPALEAPAAPALDAKAIAEDVCQRVADMDDRSSLADWPEAMLVTGPELVEIVEGEIAQAMANAVAAPIMPTALHVAARYWQWLEIMGRLTSFSTFVNEFGYEKEDCKQVYEQVVLPCFALLAAAPQTPAQEAPAAPAVPPGFALVPMRLTRAMNEVLEEEGWQWEDLLAAACAITESDHTAISRGEPSDGEIQESFAAYGAEFTDKHLEAVREIVGNALAAAPQAPAAPSADERAAYVEFLAGKFPRTYSKEDAEHWWDNDHVSALTWQAARADAAAPAAPGIDQLLDALSQHDDPCEDIADALDRVRTLRAESDRRIRAENTRVDRMAHLSAGVLNVLRVALNRANMDYRATGFKPFEIDAAKTWVASAAPAAPAVDAQAERDAAFEAVRQRLCRIPRWSFHLDSRGNIRRVDDAHGNWIEFSAAHELFDPVAVDAAIAAQAAAKGEHDHG